jgi:hypothetical protein
MIVPIIGFSQSYDDGWKDGWKAGYESVPGMSKSSYISVPFVPFDAGSYSNPYQVGYHRGSKQGTLDAEKKKNNSNNVQNTQSQNNSAYEAGEAVGAAAGAAIAAAIKKKKAKTAAEKELQKKDEGIRIIEPGLYVNISIGDKKSTSLIKLEERCIQEIKIESQVFDTDYEIIDTKITKYKKRILARVEITFRLLNTEGLIIGSTIEELKFMLTDLKELIDLGIISEEEYNKEAEPIKETLKIMLKRK